MKLTRSKRFSGSLVLPLLVVLCWTDRSYSASTTPAQELLFPALRLGYDGRLTARGSWARGPAWSHPSPALLNEDISLPSARGQVDLDSWDVTLPAEWDGRIWSVVLDWRRYTSLASQRDRWTLWREPLRGATPYRRSTGPGTTSLGIDIPVNFPRAIRRYVGDEKPRLNVSGRRKISFSGRSEWTEGQAQTATSRPSKFPSLTMKQESNFRIEGTIGRKIHIQVDQDTERWSDIENTVKLRYDGDEDEVIQEIEAGNTTLSLPSTQFVGYSAQHKGLFGIRAKAKVGPVDLVGIASQDKSSGQRKTYRGLAEETSKKIRDYEYLPRTYFFVHPSYREHYIAHSSPDSIVAIQVYVDDRNSDNDIEQRAIPGWAFADVSYPDSATTGHYEQGSFYELQPIDDYLCDNAHGYIVLRSSAVVEDNYVLAVAFRTKSGVTYGSVDALPTDSLITLQLVKTRQQRPDHPTWDLEWKNIYSLGGRDISPDGFEVTIYKEMPGQDPEDTQDGTSYLQIFGLDRHGRDLGTPPDNLIDLDKAIVDLQRGELMFPHLTPFADSTGTPPLANTVPEIYNSHDAQTRRNASQYYIEVSSKSRETRFTLGQMGILEGTEQVQLNNRRLTRGVDYQINYYTGEVTFLTDEILDPTAPLVIDYEYASLFMPQQKTLLGLRAEHRFWGSSSWGSTILYNNERSADERVKVGQEPARTVIWDTDLNLAFRSQTLTRAVDAMPLITTSVPSTINLSAEVAQSLPNPNTKGQAYLDDFEGAGNQTSLGIMRGLWTKASPPATDKNGEERGTLIWYNPWDRTPIQDIWPNKQTSAQVEDETHTLALEFAPSGDGTAHPASWGGVMRALPAGGSDFSRSKFLEVWARGQEGVLNVDLGAISEDVIVNGKLDSEDREVLGQRDGLLDVNEDVGLDGRDDLQELDYYLQKADVDMSDSSLEQKKQAFAQKYPGRDPDDPEGDNWEYEDRHDYSRINGTQNNRNDPDRSFEPDTEDINRSGYADTKNDYYHYEIDLLRDKPVPGTKNEATGWRLFRVPLWGAREHAGADFRVGSPDSTLIEYARIWLAGADSDTLRVDLAAIDVVGNNWLEDPIDAPDSLVGPTEEFKITTKGTDKDLTYEPPPGVEVQTDPNTGIREREQSLALQLEDLGPGHTASVYRSLPQKADFTPYQALKMFVFGYNASGAAPFASSDTTGQITLFIRFGADAKNYYEYRTPVREGWSSLSVDLELFPELKQLRQSGDTTAVAAYLDHYKVVGDPSLTNVKILTIGITNEHEQQAFSGEVWVDELRLDDVNRDVGTARRLSLDLGLADLMSITAGYLQKTPYFRDLKSNSGSGRDEATLRARGDLKLNKFLPDTWRVTLPVSVSWENTVAKPRFSSGSDISLDQDQSYQERTERTRWSLNSSFRKSASKHWLSRISLDRISTNLSLSREDGLSPQKPVSRSWGTAGKFTYDLSPRGRSTANLLGWLPAFVPASVRQAPVCYLPTKLSFDAQATASSAWSTDSYQKRTATSDSSLTQTYTLGLSPLRSIRGDYDLTLARDLRKNLNLSLDRLHLGTEVSRTQNASLSFDLNPIQWLKQTYSYRANYHESNDPRFSSTQEEARGRDVDTRGTGSANLTLDLHALLRPLTGAPQVPAGKAKSKQAEAKQPESGAKKAQAEGQGGIRALLGRLTQKVEPARLSYTRTNAYKHFGLMGRPALLYQFGLSERPEVVAVPSGTQRDTESATDKLSAATALDLLPNLSVKASGDYTYDLKRNANSLSATSDQAYPKVQLTWGSVEALPLLSKAARSSDVGMGYSRTRTTRGDPGQDRNLTRGELASETFTTEFSPLLSWKTRWNNGVDSAFNSTLTDEETVDYKAGQVSGKTHTRSVSYTATFSYKVSPKQGLKLPLWGRKINLTSSVDLSLGVRVNHDSQEMAKANEGYVSRSDIGEWSVSPKASYQFSRSFTGGANIVVAQRKDNKTNVTRKTREVGISGEIRF